MYSKLAHESVTQSLLLHRSALASQNSHDIIFKLKREFETPRFSAGVSTSSSLVDPDLAGSPNLMITTHSPSSLRALSDIIDAKNPGVLQKFETLTSLLANHETATAYFSPKIVKA